MIDNIHINSYFVILQRWMICYGDDYDYDDDD
jgi:hypothetical protein